RHVQIMVCHLPDVTQLLKLHGRSSNVTAAMWLAVSYNHINPTRQKTTETSIKKPYRCRENVAAPTSRAKQPDGNDRANTHRQTGLSPARPIVEPADKALRLLSSSPCPSCCARRKGMPGPRLTSNTDGRFTDQ